MPYSLELHFRPAVERRKLLAFFASRRGYKIATDDQNEIRYENETTGVGFFFTLLPKRSLFRSKIASAEFLINYYRPSYFGLEAEIELSALVTEFQPRIFDGQMKGMDEGPYSGVGFLRGWNHGNRLAVYGALSRDADLGLTALSGDELSDAWTWNYQKPALAEKLRRRQFVPDILFHVVDGRPCRLAVWPRGISVSLPKVDYVLVGRTVDGEKRFGIAPWSEILDVARTIRCDITKDPLDMEYFVTPASIMEWHSAKPLIDIDTLGPIAQDQMIDAEIWEEARKMVQLEPGVISSGSAVN